MATAKQEDQLLQCHTCGGRATLYRVVAGPALELTCRSCACQVQLEQLSLHGLISQSHAMATAPKRTADASEHRQADEDLLPARKLAKRAESPTFVVAVDIGEDPALDIPVTGMWSMQRFAGELSQRFAARLLHTYNGTRGPLRNWIWALEKFREALDRLNEDSAFRANVMEGADPHESPQYYQFQGYTLARLKHAVLLNYKHPKPPEEKEDDDPEKLKREVMSDLAEESQSGFGITYLHMLLYTQDGKPMPIEESWPQTLFEVGVYGSTTVELILAGIIRPEHSLLGGAGVNTNERLFLRGLATRAHAMATAPKRTADESKHRREDEDIPAKKLAKPGGDPTFVITVNINADEDDGPVLDIPVMGSWSIGRFAGEFSKQFAAYLLSVYDKDYGIHRNWVQVLEDFREAVDRLDNESAFRKDVTKSSDPLDSPQHYKFHGYTLARLARAVELNHPYTTLREVTNLYVEPSDGERARIRAEVKADLAEESRSGFGITFLHMILVTDTDTTIPTRQQNPIILSEIGIDAPTTVYLHLSDEVVSTHALLGAANKSEEASRRSRANRTGYYGGTAGLGGGINIGDFGIGAGVGLGVVAGPKGGGVNGGLGLRVGDVGLGIGGGITAGEL